MISSLDTGLGLLSKCFQSFNINSAAILKSCFKVILLKFNFNLASQNSNIRSSSIKLAKKAIDLCYKIESPLYTFHAGFTVDPPKLGKPFPKNNIFDRNKAIETYIKSTKNLVNYAQKKGIKIAMEPNVVQKFNLVNNHNKLCLFAEFEEIKIILNSFSKEELGILLDLGHTAVTSHWLRFDKDKFVQKCSKQTYAIHVSNNNGLQDQHKSLTKKCWQISKLKKFKNIPIILETMNLSIEKIKQNIQLVENTIK